jgi:hypothetical protein
MTAEAKPTPSKRGGKRAGAGSGGARPGAGKPLGPITRRSAAAAKKLSHDETAVTPLEVMVLTMRELWGDGSVPIETKKEACSIAEKCAAYLHPRLAATQVTADITGTIKGASMDDLKSELKAILAEIAAE